MTPRPYSVELADLRAVAIAQAERLTAIIEAIDARVPGAVRLQLALMEVRSQLTRGVA